MAQHFIEIDRDGMTLRGTANVPMGSKRFPAVMMLHGFTGQRIEGGFLYVRLARALETIGIASVRFDFMHSGESDGSFEQMLVTSEVADAIRVTQWMGAQPFVDRSRMGVIGFSLGGLVASYVSGRTHAHQARVLIAPTTEKNLCRFDKNHNEAGIAAVGPHRLHPDFFADVMTLNAVEDAARRNIPTLLVQGTSDTAVPPAVSQTYVDAMTEAGARVEHLLIRDADHGFNRPAWQKQLVDAIVGFLSVSL